MCDVAGEARFLFLRMVLEEKRRDLVMWYSVTGIVISFLGTAFSLWKILMRDERIAGTWRDIPNLHKNAIKERRYVIVGIILIFIGYLLQIIGIFNP